MEKTPIPKPNPDLVEKRRTLAQLVIESWDALSPEAQATWARIVPEVLEFIGPEQTRDAM